MTQGERKIEAPSEQVPSIITDEYLKKAMLKVEEFITSLRSQENYKLAIEVMRLVAIIENLHFQLKMEEQKVVDLKDERIDAAGRIEQSIKISQTDHDVIKKLKNEVQQAWKEADVSKLREQHANESLNVTREKYLKLIEKAKKSSSNEEVMDELGEHKMTVLQQCERLTVEVDELKKRLYVQRAYSEELQEKLKDALEKNRDLFREWDNATNETLSNKNSIEKLQKQLADKNEEYEKTMETFMHFQKTSDERNNRLILREKQMVEMADKIHDGRVYTKALLKNKSKLEFALKSCRREYAELQSEMDNLQKYARLKDDENRKLANERERNAKKVESAMLKVSSVEKMLTRKEQEILLKKSEIVTIEKEQDKIKKSCDDMKHENDKLIRKSEQLMKEIERLNASISNLKNEKQKLDEEKIYINNDLKASIEREKKTSANVKKLQANIETVESEKLYLTESIKQLNEDIELRKKQYEKMKMELNESNEQVAQYKHEYNSTLKRLKDAKSDFQRCHEKESDVKDRLVNYKSQIDDITDKLSVKMSEIASLMKENKTLGKRNRELKRDFEKSEESLRLCRIQLKNVEDDNKLIKDELRENHSRFIKMKNQSDKILRERDLIANQMYRKTDENALLEDQVSTLKMSIERGNSMYNGRLEDMKIMKNEIQELRSQCNVLKRGLENTADMRHEVFQLNRKLNQEMAKAKVLEQEMTTPLNVHRWRKLNHRDPGRMDLLKKSQRLQKNCLKQSVKIQKAEELIKVLEEKVQQLEKELQKRPSSEMSEKLLFTRIKLHDNTKRMKAAIALYRATESDMNLKDNKIKQLEIELNEMKSQLFKQKRIKEKSMEMKKNSQHSKEVGEELKIVGTAFKRGL